MRPSVAVTNARASGAIFVHGDGRKLVTWLLKGLEHIFLLMSMNALIKQHNSSEMKSISAGLVASFLVVLTRTRCGGDAATHNNREIDPISTP